LGDSISLGFALHNDPMEHRGLGFSCGGDQNATTLPNLLRTSSLLRWKRRLGSGMMEVQARCFSQHAITSITPLGLLQASLVVDFQSLSGITSLTATGGAGATLIGDSVGTKVPSTSDAGCNTKDAAAICRLNAAVDGADMHRVLAQLDYLVRCSLSNQPP
jgi:hypothetical protein